MGPGDRAEFVRGLEAGAAFYAPWIPALEPGESWDDVFDREQEKSADDRHVRLAGFLPDGRIAGCFNLGEIVRGVFQSAYASWRTSSELLRQGYGAEGVLALLDLAFGAQGLGLHRVQANVIPANVASIRLAERVGFRREGLALRYLKIGGSWMDHVMLAKLADEHPSRPLSFV
jgi:[ribosomal protein S5]-alanine N-acetyltransferase